MSDEATLALRGIREDIAELTKRVQRLESRMLTGSAWAGILWVAVQLIDKF